MNNKGAGIDHFYRPTCYQQLLSTVDNLCKQQSDQCLCYSHSENRANPVISHCSYSLLKMQSGFKYKSLTRWFKNQIIKFAKKFILISFWIFKYCFYYSFILYYCVIFYSLDAGFFNTYGCQTIWIQIRPNFVRPNLGLNCLQRL